MHEPMYMKWVLFSFTLKTKAVSYGSFGRLVKHLYVDMKLHRVNLYMQHCHTDRALSSL
jgi:hypothetical protein